jgi:hypothetical protein
MLIQACRFPLSKWSKKLLPVLDLKSMLAEVSSRFLSSVLQFQTQASKLIIELQSLHTWINWKWLQHDQCPDLLLEDLLEVQDCLKCASTIDFESQKWSLSYWLNFCLNSILEDTLASVWKAWSPTNRSWSFSHLASLGWWWTREGVPIIMLANVYYLKVMVYVFHLLQKGEVLSKVWHLVSSKVWPMRLWKAHKD